MEIIALSGYARSGKDEAASVLVNDFGFVQIAFADKLREVLYALNPWVHQEHSNVFGGIYHHCQKPLQEVIDEYGWSGYKETLYGQEVRRLLQRLGTEAGRQTLWDTIWIDAAFADVPPDGKVVISDARFFNEFDAVRERGGECWRIERPGVGPVSDHPSETEAPRYPFFSKRIFNDDSLEEYYSKVREAYREVS